jgi:hypothetical protein
MRPVVQEVRDARTGVARFLCGNATARQRVAQIRWFELQGTGIWHP